MATTVKQPSKKRRPAAKAATSNSASKRAAARASDVTLRRKIAKSLDSEAFAKHHKTNSASAKYWEAEE